MEPVCVPQLPGTWRAWNALPRARDCLGNRKGHSRNTGHVSRCPSTHYTRVSSTLSTRRTSSTKLCTQRHLAQHTRPQSQKVVMEGSPCLPWPGELVHHPVTRVCDATPATVAHLRSAPATRRRCGWCPCLPALTTGSNATPSKCATARRTMHAHAVVFPCGGSGGGCSGSGSGSGCGRGCDRRAPILGLGLGLGLGLLRMHAGWHWARVSDMGAHWKRWRERESLGRGGAHVGALVQLSLGTAGVPAALDFECCWPALRCAAVAGLHARVAVWLEGAAIRRRQETPQTQQRLPLRRERRRGGRRHLRG